MKYWRAINSLLLVVTLGLALFLPGRSYAQSVQGQAISIEGNGEEYVNEITYILEQPFGGKKNIRNVGEYIQTVYQFGLGLVGIIAVVLIMFGGLRWVAAAGNESTIGEAKEMIVSAVTGLVIALLSYIILLTISPQLLKLDLAVAKIPIPKHTSDMYVCPNDTTLTEKTGGYYCKGLGSGQVSSTDINSWIAKYNKAGISPTFLKAIMKTESGFCVDNRSDIKNKDTGETRHACGLMQVLPTTAKAYASTCGLPECASVTSDADGDPQATACCTAMRTNPEKAICAGVSFMSALKGNSYTNGDEALMAAAYNGGTCNSKKSNGALCESSACPGQLMYECEANKGYAETRNYVKKVSANKEFICNANGNLACVPYNGSASNVYCKAVGEVAYALASCNGSAATCPAISTYTWITLPKTCPTGQHVAFSNGQQLTAGSFTSYSSEPNCAP